MATIAKTFGEYLQDYYKSSDTGSLSSYLSSYSVRYSNDLSTYLNGNKTLSANEILCIVASGNATRVKLDTLAYYATTVNIYFYVPVNNRENVLYNLEKFALEESDEGNAKSLGSTYYASFGYNTPICDGSSVMLNGVKCVTIVIMAIVNYADISFAKIDIPYVSLDGVQLKNITSFTPTNTANNISQSVIGSRYEEKTIESEGITYAMTVLLDTSDALHNKLIRTNFMYDTIVVNAVSASASFPISMSVIIASATPASNNTYYKTAFTGNVVCSAPVNVRGFTTMNITITR